MTTQGIVAIVLVCAVLAAWIVHLVVRGKLYVGYGVVWLAVFGAAAALVAVPPATRLLTRVSGAEYPASALTLAALVFIVLVLIYFSVQLSIIAARVQRVAQELGTLMMDQRESAPVDDR